MPHYRRKTHPRSKSRNPTISLTWVWIFLGILIGITFAVAIYIFFFQGPYQAPNGKISVPALAGKASKTTSDLKNAQEKINKKEKASAKRYEFYTLLPGMEIQLPDKPLADKSSDKKFLDKQHPSHPFQSSQPDPSSPPSNSAKFPKPTQHIKPTSQPLQKSVPSKASSHPYSQTNVSPQAPSHTPFQKPAEVSPATPSPLNTHTRKTPNINTNTPSKTSNIKVFTNDPALSATNANNAKEAHLSTLPVAQFIVQAGIFQALNQADELKAKLTLQGFNTRIQKVCTQEGHTWFRVTLGPFASETSALKQKKKLEEQKIQGILILQRPNA